MPPPACPAQEVILSLCAEVAATVGTDERTQLRQIVDSMNAPIRVAVVGRVNSGKSTLVNALIGRRIAATAAQDCTRVVTEYRFGAPERAEAVYHDGRRVQLEPDLAQIDALVDATGLRRIEVVIQSAPLTQMTLVDTPGLAGLENDFSWNSAEARAAVDADVMLYLFRGAARIDDATVVREFVGAAGNAPRATHCIGLLSHADNFGAGAWGPTDPISDATASAAHVQQTLAGCFSAVVPISPLLAETVRTGHLTEDDARALRGLRETDPTLLQYFGQLSSEPAAQQLSNLSTLVGAYGLRHGRDHANSAGALAGWLDERSGMIRFEHHLTHDLLPTAQMARAERAITQLAHWARSSGPLPSRIVEEAQHGPLLHPIREFRSYQMLLDQCPDSFLIGPLAAVVAAGARGRRLGLLGSTTDPKEEALRRSSCYQAEAGLAQRGVEAESARTLSISYLNLWRDLCQPDNGAFAGSSFR